MAAIALDHLEVDAFPGKRDAELELAILRGKRVAIAGMGGVGGGHLLTLARLGIGTFNIADFDTFELANFNRQAGAAISSLGRSKVQMLADMACDINPELSIRQFSEGITLSNLDDFLKDVDIYVDGKKESVTRKGSMLRVLHVIKIMI